MLLTLALVVICASIMVFFSQEFMRTFKRIFALPGARLLLPILFASWLVYTFDYWVLWAVFYYRETLFTGLHFLEGILPAYAWTLPAIVVCLIWCVTILPVLALDYYYRRKSHHGYPYPMITSAIIFIVTAILLLAL
ncbi:MAG: hypothetical protein BGO90_03620 [Legionella sp. 40-6]|nr:hypothetical protein [Legionella sp.]OJY20254.1 MAG: hypothetical protein BGO90_03620 [Legionella sp. 40-6]